MATQILPTGIKNFGSTTIDNIVLDTSGGVDIDDGHLVVTHGGNVTVDSALQVNSTLNVTGNATLGGTLTVNGSLDFNADINADGRFLTIGGMQVTSNLTPTTGAGWELFRSSSGYAQMQAYDRDGAAVLGGRIHTSNWRLGEDGESYFLGNLGIGTTDPQRALVVSDAGAEGFEFYPGSSDTGNTLNHYDRVSAAYIDILTNADQHIFGRADGEKMRLDSSGRLLVGTSSSIDVASTAPAIMQVTQGKNGLSGAFYSIANALGPGGVIALGHGRNSTSGLLSNGDVMGQIRFAGADGNDMETAGAMISAEVDGTPGSNDMPGRLVFSTTADGAGSVTERMRIDSLGLVGIGRTTDSTYNSYVLQLRGSDTNGTFLHISTPSDGDSVGNDGMVLGKDNNNGYLYVRESQPLTIGTGDVERMRIDSSGRLMVNASSSFDTSSKVQIAGDDTTRNLAFKYTGTSGLTEQGIQWFDFRNQINASIANSLQNDNADQQAAHLVFKTSTAGTLAERMRIDSNGRLLVGTQDSRGVGQNANTAPVQIETASNVAAVQIIANASSSASPSLFFGKSRGGELGSNMVVQDDDTLGGIAFCGADGSDLDSYGAEIKAQVDGDPDPNNDGQAENGMPGRLVFSTTAAGATVPTERMTISQDGKLNVPGVYNATTADAANIRVTSAGDIVRSTSSLKYKTDIETLENTFADAILNCRPVWFRSLSATDNPSWGYWGFIAEEVAEIDPRLVSWKTTKTTYDEKGSTVRTACDPEPEGVQYDRFVPHLLNLIKRQKEQIEALEARVTALES